MSYSIENYRASAEFLRARLGDFVPKVAMILGSGLGYLGDQVEDPVAVSYQDIPYFKASTAPGHKGRLVFGALEGKPVAVMQGRMHHYEGYSYEEVSYAVRVLRLLGCDTLIVTNAAGCVNTAWQAGDLMLITDQIKIFMESPLRGENLPEFGVRFPDSSHLYTPALQDLARQSSGELGIDLKEGVYMYFPGPQYETPAEVRFARIAGADAGAGLHPVLQHGRRHPGPAPQRAGGAGRRRGLQGEILAAGAGLPEKAVVRRTPCPFSFRTSPPSSWTRAGRCCPTPL